MTMFAVHNGDVLEGLAKLEDGQFDACFCDPPYGISFMGKAWDHGVPSVDVWRDVLRVLKPGAWLLAFGGTRTYHRLACAIEDAGFEIRDCCVWLYGSGFPKSHDISKAIDKAAGIPLTVIGPNPLAKMQPGQKGTVAHGNRNRHEMLTQATSPEAARWAGYGTALKPAWEPILVCMKPVDGTFAENALRYGCGGLNIDACRIGTTKDVPASVRRAPQNAAYGDLSNDPGTGTGWNPNIGRWPANLILDEHSARLVDEQSGISKSSKLNTIQQARLPQSKGAERLPVRIDEGYTDSGGASRFFYIAKADSDERHIAGINDHPTVKPIDLTAYLAKMILPPERDTERKLLVPYSGSGSEIAGALRAGWDYVYGIEIEENYAEFSRKRIVEDAPLFNSVAIG